MLTELKRFVGQELKHAAEHPSPAIPGHTVNVLPKIDEQDVVLQFNGWAVKLNSDGTWAVADTAAQGWGGGEEKEKT